MKSITRFGASLGALLVAVCTVFALGAAPAEAHHHGWHGGYYGYHHWRGWGGGWGYAPYAAYGPSPYYGPYPYSYYGPEYYGRPRLSLRQTLYGLGL